MLRRLPKVKWKYLKIGFLCIGLMLFVPGCQIVVPSPHLVSAGPQGLAVVLDSLGRLNLNVASLGRVFLFNPATGEIQMLPIDQVREARWIEASTKRLFAVTAARETGGTALQILEIGAGQPQTLLAMPGFIRVPQLSPDGQLLSFLHLHAPTPPNKTLPELRDWSLQVRPFTEPGRELVKVGTIAEETVEAAVAYTWAGESLLILGLEGAAHQSSRLVLWQLPCRLSACPGPRRTLAEWPVSLRPSLLLLLGLWPPEAFLTVSPDNQQAVVAIPSIISEERFEIDLYEVDLAAGQSQLLRREALFPAFSPEGKLAYLALLGKVTAIYLRDVQGGERRLTPDLSLSPFSPFFFFFHLLWLSEQELGYIQAEEKSPLKAVNIETGQIRDLSRDILRALFPLGPLPADCTVGLQPFDEELPAVLAALPEGSVVCLGPGPGWVNLTISNALTLRGSGRGRTVLLGGQRGIPAIRIIGQAQVQLKGLTVTGVDGEECWEQPFPWRPPANCPAGLLIKDQAWLTLEDAEVSGNAGSGVHLSDSAKISIHDVIIQNNGFLEGMSSYYGNGLEASGSGWVVLRNVVISSNNRTGLSVSGSATAALTDSQVSSNKLEGLLVRDQAQVRLINSTISDNGSGGLQVRLISPTISDSGGGGLIVEDQAQVEVHRSRVLGNQGCGIWVRSPQARLVGTPNEMRHNEVDLCGFAPISLRQPFVPQTDKTQLEFPGDYPTLQEAVDAIAPGGTILVQAGRYEVGLTLWKPLTLRGKGSKHTVLKPASSLSTPLLVISVPAEAQGVVLEGLAVNGFVKYSPDAEYGLLIYGQAILRDVEVSEVKGSGLEVRGSAQVSLQNSEVSSNSFGIVARDSARVNLQGSRVLRNREHGLVTKDSAQVGLSDSQVIRNFHNGLEVSGSARVSIIRSQISESDGNGLALGNQANVEVRQSRIEGNGLDYSCRFSNWICNGVFIQDQAHLTLIDVIIKGNTDWGLTAQLKQCGYDEDSFIGRVVFEGINTIEGNNTSGNQNGMGNQGNHPWNRPNVPDGQVCLP